jgi:hypothetical protein
MVAAEVDRESVRGRGLWLALRRAGAPRLGWDRPIDLALVLGARGCGVYGDSDAVGPGRV